MDKYFEFSKSKDESRLSIDSQELLRQVENKIHQSQSPIFISPQKQQMNYADHFDQKEQIDYLSFKEQTIIKRLLNLRDDYKQFLKNVQSYQEELIQSIKEVLKKVVDKGNQYLQDQEYELRQQLQEIQKNKELINSYSNCQIIQSPLKQKQNFFSEIKTKISELNNQILEFFDHHNNSIQSSGYQKKLNFSNYKEQSSKKKFRGSSSPFKDIDRVLQMKTSSSKSQLQSNYQPQDLNQFIDVLKLKINNNKNNYLLQSRPTFTSNFLQSKLNTNSKRLSIEHQLQSQYKTFFQSVF